MVRIKNSITIALFAISRPRMPSKKENAGTIYISVRAAWFWTWKRQEQAQGEKKKNRRDLGVIKEEEGETTARISRKSTKRRRSWSRRCVSVREHAYRKLVRRQNKTATISTTPCCHWWRALSHHRQHHTFFCTTSPDNPMPMERKTKAKAWRRPEIETHNWRRDRVTERQQRLKKTERETHKAW